MYKRVLVTCRGIAPYLMNPATPELLDQIRTKTSPPRRTDWSPREEATTRLCWGDAFGMPGTVGIPSLNLFSSLRHAGRLVKKGTKQVSTANSTIMPSFLSIEEEFLPFKIEGSVDDAWTVDLRRGTNPNGGELVVLVRPKFPEWEFDVTVQIDESVNDELIRKLFDTAGSSYGLGDFRPGKGGPFGRFAVASWVEQDGSTNGKAKVGVEELAAAVA